ARATRTSLMTETLGYLPAWRQGWVWRTFDRMLGDWRRRGALLAAVMCSAACSNGTGGRFDDGRTAAASTRPASLCGTATLVSQAQIWGLQLAVDGAQVYYTAYGAGPDQHQHQLWSVPVAGGEPSLLWQGPSGFLGSGLAVA